MKSKPPKVLPDGTRNPEYGKWLRSQPGQKAKHRIRMANWRKTEKGRASTKASAEKYRKSEKGAEWMQKRKAKIQAEFPLGTMACAECGQLFSTEKVLERGWPKVTKFRTICDICQ